MDFEATSPDLCPDSNVLTAFLTGNILDPSVFEKLEKHIYSCDSCISSLSEIESSGDPLVASLKRGNAQAADQSDFSVDQGFQHALERVLDLARNQSTPDQVSLNSGIPPGSDLPEIPGYEIRQEIGRGGMGVVYEAQHLALKRRVALKVIPASQSTNESTAVKRFQNEARAAAALHHSNIVPVFEVGNTDRYNYYAMQFIPGDGLDRLINSLANMRREDAINTGLQPDSVTRDSDRNGPRNEDSFLNGESVWAANETTQAPASSNENLPEKQSQLETAKQNSDTISNISKLTGKNKYAAEVARIGFEVADALAHAHERGVIHRDIKPSNILLDTNARSWVADFGLAKTEDVQLTQTGSVMGTLRYMSPERFSGSCDERGDVYGLGVTLYELLTLQPLFNTNDHLTLIDKIKSASPKPIREIDRSIPLDLATIVHKCLAKEASHRYRSAALLAEDLQRFRDGRPIKARQVGSAEKLALWARKNKAIASLLTVLFTGLLATAVGATWAAFTYRNMADTQRQLTEKAQESETQATQSAKRAIDVRDLFIDSLGQATVDEGGKSVTVYASLNESIEGIRENIEDDPETSASLLAAIARVFESLGLYQESLELNKEAADICHKFAGADDHDAINYEIQVANLLGELGRDKENLVLLSDLLVRTTDPEQRLSITSSLGECLRQEKKYQEAIDLLEPALAEAKSYGDGDEKTTLGLQGSTTLDLMTNLVDAHRYAGNLQTAIDIATEAYELCRARDGDGTYWANHYRNSLMVVLHEDGQLEKVLPIMEEMSAEFRSSLGKDHPHAIVSAINLAHVYHSAGNLQKAIQLCEDNVDLAKARGEKSREFRYLSRTLAKLQIKAGNYDESFALAWLQSLKTTSGFEDHSARMSIYATLASCALENDQIEKAIKYAQQCLKFRETEEDPDHLEFLRATSIMGSAISQQDEVSSDEMERAESLLLEHSKKCRTVSIRYAARKNGI